MSLEQRRGVFRYRLSNENGKLFWLLSYFFCSVLCVKWWRAVPCPPHNSNIVRMMINQLLVQDILVALSDERNFIMYDSLVHFISDCLEPRPKMSYIVLYCFDLYYSTNSRVYFQRSVRARFSHFSPTFLIHCILSIASMEALSRLFPFSRWSRRNERAAVMTLNDLPADIIRIIGTMDTEALESMRLVRIRNNSISATGVLRNWM